MFRILLIFISFINYSLIESKGNPIGELSFIPEQIPFSIPWRNENSKNQINIYSYGIFEQESYRIVCTVHHNSNLKKSLNVFIQYYQCSIDNCLADLHNKMCRNENIISTTSTRISDYQTQFVSINSHKLDNPTIGHQYLCCYEQNNLINIAKAITILSNNRNMFSIDKPEFSLVTGDSLTYRCQGHELIYNDLQMIYNDGLSTYERSLADIGWRLKGTQQIKQIEIDGNSRTSKSIRSSTIEVKTPPLRRIGANGYFQCIGLSERSDLIPNINDTYIINVDDPLPLEFINNIPTVSRLERKTGDKVEFDCKFKGHPKPKLVWLRGKLLLNNSDGTLQFGDNNGSLSIIRTQALDTGYYTCELNNGRDAILRRSFDLRIQGTNVPAKFSRITTLFLFISGLLLLLMLILFIIFALKFYRMKKKVRGSLFYENQPVGKEDKSLPAMGQFGVVYQVGLPDVDLVAAKMLPETIRNSECY